MYKNRIFNALAIIRSFIVLITGLLMLFNYLWANQYYFIVNIAPNVEHQDTISMIGLGTTVVGIVLLFISNYKALKESIKDGINEGIALTKKSNSNIQYTMSFNKYIYFILFIITMTLFYIGYQILEINNGLMSLNRHITISYTNPGEFRKTIYVIFFSAGIILTISTIYYWIQKLACKVYLKINT